MTTERRNISLGIDIGTSSVKICLLDIDTQCTVFTTSEPTRATVTGLDAGKDEQDVNKIIDAVHVCLMRVTDKNRADVKCIAVSGQMHGVVFWNSEAQRRLDGSRPVTIRTSNLYTWQDKRATSEFLASLPEPNSHQSLSTGRHGRIQRGDRWSGPPPPPPPKKKKKKHKRIGVFSSTGPDPLNKTQSYQASI